MKQNTTITRTSLHYREGNSDKEYHVAVEPEGEGYVVTFTYGRRGSTLTTGRKTTNAVSLAEANTIHDKLVRQKTAKGYHLSGEEPQAIAHANDAGKDSGIRCQLLNPVDEEVANDLLIDERYCLQEKFDGRRLMVRKRGDEITGINRRGLVVSVPEPIRKAVSKLPVDVLLDGEAVGDTLHAFDLLEPEGHDIRRQRYLSRYAGLLALLLRDSPALQCVGNALDTEDKITAYEQLRQDGKEGVVFKKIDAPFSAGRPNSGGSQRKFKFVETASFVVTGINQARSVTLGLHDGDTPVPAGKVAIPPNQAIPVIGAVVEVRYLYAYRQSGAIYQPVYLCERDDIPASECGVDQLKYKAEPLKATA